MRVPPKPAASPQNTRPNWRSRKAEAVEIPEAVQRMNVPDLCRSCGQSVGVTLAKRAYTLHLKGLNGQQIAKELDLPEQYARDLVNYVARTEGPRMEITIRPTLMESLRQMCKVSEVEKQGEGSLTLAEYCSQVLEVAIIEFRRLRVVRDLTAPGAAVPKQGEDHRTKMTPTKLAQLRIMARSKEFSHEKLGQRFGVSRQLVGRVLADAQS